MQVAMDKKYRNNFVFVGIVILSLGVQKMQLVVVLLCNLIYIHT
jgi:uncharacterized membrane protein